MNNNNNNKYFYANITHLFQALKFYNNLFLLLLYLFNVYVTLTYYSRIFKKINIIIIKKLKKKSYRFEDVPPDNFIKNYKKGFKINFSETY